MKASWFPLVALAALLLCAGFGCDGSAPPASIGSGNSAAEDSSIGDPAANNSLGKADGTASTADNNQVALQQNERNAAPPNKTQSQAVPPQSKPENAMLIYTYDRVRCRRMPAGRNA